jgi:hypothetical protein
MMAADDCAATSSSLRRACANESSPSKVNDADADASAAGCRSRNGVSSASTALSAEWVAEF